MLYNHEHAQQILSGLPDGPVLLAGDFNAEPHDRAMQAYAASGRFGPGGGPGPTFPADAPRRRIDDVLAPAGWERLDDRTLRIGSSDHLAVLARFQLPAAR